MKRFLLTISFIIVLFFGMRTFCCDVLMHRGCVPVHAQGIPEINKCAADVKRIHSFLLEDIKKLSSKSYDVEFCLKHILSLIDFELEILDNLIEGKTGLPIYQLNDRRNILIMQTVPSVVRIYDSIMNCASADASLLCKLRNIIRQQERECTFLFYNQKEHFLQHMITVLESYYQALRERSF